MSRATPRQSIRAERDALVVQVWNLQHPIGTPVLYWTGAKDGPGKAGKTRSEAELLGGHTPVVWVTGHYGCIALTHVEVAPAEPDGRTDTAPPGL